MLFFELSLRFLFHPWLVVVLSSDWHLLSASRVITFWVWFRVVNRPAITHQVTYEI